MSRKTRRRKNAIQIVSLIAAVIIVIVCSVLFQNWWNNRPGPDPREVTITVTAGEHTQEFKPYSLCEPGVPCEESTVTTLDPAIVESAEQLEISVPKEIYDHDWSLLAIYDNPAANDEFYYGPYEKQTASVPLSVDPVSKESTERPKLIVAEIKSVMIGPDKAGNETPYTVTWSIAAEKPGN